MQHMYTTESEAISNIINGVEFKNIRYDYFRSNKRVVLNAILYQGPETLKSANKKLRDDKDFILSVLTSDPFCLEYVSSRLKDDLEVVLASCKKNPMLINLASSTIQKTCKNKDPILTIESILLNKKLEIDLEKHVNVVDKKTKI